MGDAADAEFLELAVLVVDIAREIQLRAAMSTPVVPLTQTQGQVMRYVHDHPGCSATDIADGSGLQRANVSAALRDLRGRGYITSRRDEDDGRAIRIDATPLADETIAKLRRSWAELVSDAWNADAADDHTPNLDHLTADLARIREGLRAHRATKAFRIPSPAPLGGGTDSTHHLVIAEGPSTDGD
ncbi:DNA-binding transcriptional regulator, MarR family [Microbacterium sp. cf046]|uniref:MarR family winged helix-turn-helix transcriptional regulator n=1 Tax=Microbacterium sp. cf046 TaxID=1761803 RepID=UPI0008F4296B|nr:MarR family transcriptional regulator [Microbacterium sp. cf046]SFR89601.1 DNA-binding transcriptional regulator, MarR family [Microbacterium sp. cf046]